MPECSKCGKVYKQSESYYDRHIKKCTGKKKKAPRKEDKKTDSHKSSLPLSHKIDQRLPASKRIMTRTPAQ